MKNQRSRSVLHRLSIDTKTQDTCLFENLPNTALLASNHQILVEAGSIFYKENTFYFSMLCLLQQFLSEWRSPSAACLGLNGVIRHFKISKRNHRFMDGLLHPNIRTLHFNIFHWLVLKLEFTPDTIFWSHTIKDSRASIDVFSAQLRFQTNGSAASRIIPGEELAEMLSAKMSQSWTEVMKGHPHEPLNTLALAISGRPKTSLAFRTGDCVKLIMRCCIGSQLRQGVVDVVYDSDVNGWELSDNNTSLKIKRAV